MGQAADGDGTVHRRGRPLGGGGPPAHGHPAVPATSAPRRRHPDGPEHHRDASPTRGPHRPRPRPADAPAGVAAEGDPPVEAGGDRPLPGQPPTAPAPTSGAPRSPRWASTSPSDWTPHCCPSPSCSSARRCRSCWSPSAPGRLPHGHRRPALDRSGPRCHRGGLPVGLAGRRPRRARRRPDRRFRPGRRHGGAVRSGGGRPGVPGVPHRRAVLPDGGAASVPRARGTGRARPAWRPAGVRPPRRGWCPGHAGPRRCR